MCIGLTSANSILVVTFANQRMEEGDDKATAAIVAGFTRLRPVFMTAGAMILGMIPMALGVGEGGEQNAPSGARGRSAACCSPQRRRCVRSRRLPNVAPGRSHGARLLPSRRGGEVARMKSRCESGSR